MSAFDWREAPKGDFAVIGHPVSHSLSPRMHLAAYAALGLDHTYCAISVAPEEFAEAVHHLKGLGYRGLNVTIPHKSAAFAWCQSTCETSQKLQVCNTLDLQDHTGINTDVPGFLKSLPGHAPRALVLGAGGSARAVVYALVRSGTEVTLWNRTRARAEELVKELDLPVQVVDAPSVAGHTLVVNTTSTGLSGDSLPIDWNGTNPDQLLASDLAYGAEATPFMLEARSHGIAAMDGRRMLMEQGAFAFEWWLNVPAPREAMWEAIQ